MNIDTNTVYIVLIAILAIVAIFGFLRYQRKGNVELQGPFGTKLKFEGENDKSSDKIKEGVNVADVRSTEGGLYADDGTGRVNVERVEVKDDIMISSKPSNGK